MARNQRDDPPRVSQLIVGEDSITNMTINELDTEANGTATVTISNVAPAGVTTATISKWLKISIDGDNTYYIPLWT